MFGLTVWVLKLIFGYVPNVSKKVHVDWKSIFNNEISFECRGWSGTFLLL